MIQFRYDHKHLNLREKNLVKLAVVKYKIQIHVFSSDNQECSKDCEEEEIEEIEDIEEIEKRIRN